MTHGKPMTASASRVISPITLVGVICLAVGVRALPAEEFGWPQFLGPNRTGISQETGLLKSWPDEGPPVVWRVAGGVGMSGIAVDRGRAITMLQDDQDQYVVALDAKTGDGVWRTPIAPVYINSMGNGPRATPTISGDRVFAFSGEGVLACLSFADGSIAWSKNTVEEMGGKVADYGMASSPLVVDDRVIVTVGAPDAAIVAYDISDGSVAWRYGNEKTGYSSPQICRIGDTDQLVAFTGTSALGLSPSSGDLLWQFPYVTDYDCNIAVPLAVANGIFISAGENHGSTLLRLEKDGDDWITEVVWASEGRSSVMRNEWQTSLLIDGYLYGFDNVGSAGPVTHLSCVEAATGELRWQEIRFGKGNAIAADGKLFVVTMKGELIVVQAKPTGFEEIGRMEVLEGTRQAPSLANGLLYIRDDEDIVCIDVRD